MHNFAVHHGYSDFEVKAIHLASVIYSDKYKISYFQKPSDVPAWFIPLGDIPWVSEVHGNLPRPDYYPDFLHHLLYRKVWETDVYPMEKGIFIKPSDIPKRFQARITTGTYKGKKKPPFWCSEVVSFVNEWRLYFVAGKIVHIGWYDGINDDDILFPLDQVDLTTVPDNFYGVIDLGELSTGEIALVEAAESYSMGWYGRLSEGHIYADFVAASWHNHLALLRKI
jgi:hypothetical protein